MVELVVRDHDGRQPLDALVGELGADPGAGRARVDEHRVGVRGLEQDRVPLADVERRDLDARAAGLGSLAGKTPPPAASSAAAHASAASTSSTPPGLGARPLGARPSAPTSQPAHSIAR